MHDRQWLQSSLGHDRSLHEVCRDRALHHRLSRIDVRSPNQYVDSETWLSDNVSIGQRDSFPGRTYERAHETFTGGLVERQNQTAVSMLRVYCSRYMTDWDRYLSQVMGAYNSTQHSTTGVSPHMMLTGHEKSLPLTFFYPEYEGKKTSPRVYVRDAIRRQQELNDL